MRARFLLPAATALAFAASLAPRLPAPLARACATVASRPVHLEGEEALIVWDAARRKQHFLRHAIFDGAEEDFGFLVPTPSRPELAEADDRVFDELFRLYRRPVPRGRARGRSRSRAPAVTVVERRQVAGLDAAVLAARDPDALNGWLSTHGYPSGRPLRDWLAPYVDRGCFVTAFRYAPPEGGAAFESRALRMSFDADEPFFPYSEPQGRGGPARPFRVSVLAPHRVAAREGPQAARLRVGYAARLSASRLARVLEPAGISRGTLGGPAAWLTVFDERRSRRGRHDLTFPRAAAQTPVRGRLTTRLVSAGSPTSPPGPPDRTERPTRRGPPRPVLDSWDDR